MRRVCCAQNGCSPQRPISARPARRSAAPAPGCAGARPAALCGTCPRPSTARPPAPCQTSRAAPRQCARAPRSAPLRLPHPCAPGSILKYSPLQRRIRWPPKAPGRPARRPAGRFCRPARRTCPARAGRAARPKGARARRRWPPAHNRCPRGTAGFCPGARFRPAGKSCLHRRARGTPKGPSAAKSAPRCSAARCASARGAPRPAGGTPRHSARPAARARALQNTSVPARSGALLSGKKWLHNAPPPAQTKHNGR